MKIAINNSFHNTLTFAVTRMVRGIPTLSRAQVRRIRKALCGVDGCQCSGPLGNRGEQPHYYRYESNINGSVSILPPIK